MRKFFGLIALLILGTSSSSSAATIKMRGTPKVSYVAHLVWRLDCTKADRDCITMETAGDGHWNVTIHWNARPEQTGTLVPGTLVENPDDETTVTLHVELPEEEGGGD